MMALLAFCPNLNLAIFVFCGMSAFKAKIQEAVVFNMQYTCKMKHGLGFRI
jgi:hypothetical protein